MATRSGFIDWFASHHGTHLEGFLAGCSVIVLVLVISISRTICSPVFPLTRDRTAGHSGGG